MQTLPWVAVGAGITCLVRRSSEEKEAAPLGLHGSNSKTLREQKTDVGKDQ